jgi:hypothetical protein
MSIEENLDRIDEVCGHQPTDGGLNVSQRIKQIRAELADAQEPTFDDIYQDLGEMTDEARDYAQALFDFEQAIQDAHDEEAEAEEIPPVDTYIDLLAEHNNEETPDDSSDEDEQDTGEGSEGSSGSGAGELHGTSGHIPGGSEHFGEAPVRTGGDADQRDA